MNRFLCALLLLAGCTSALPSEKAEKDLAFVKANGGSPREVCDAERSVEVAYRQERNAEKYRQAKLNANIVCWPVDHG